MNDYFVHPPTIRFLFLIIADFHPAASLPVLVLDAYP